MTMGRRLLPALAAIVCLLAGPALAELSAGERAYITGDFAAARQAFEAAAKDGDPEAQTRLIFAARASTRIRRPPPDCCERQPRRDIRRQS